MNQAVPIRYSNDPIVNDKLLYSGKNTNKAPTQMVMIVINAIRTKKLGGMS